MPELPEVETVRRGLEPFLTGATLERVEARRPDLRFPLPKDFVARLNGARIEALNRRGKYILAPLDNGETLLVHLGMTGRFEIQGHRRPGDFAMAAPANPKHAHVVFHTSAGATITYHDARRFGFMDLLETARVQLIPPFAAMGPEPLSADFSGKYLRAKLAGRRAPIKPALLDQSTVAGLGNIYVCEALHRAGISPLRAAGGVSRAKLFTLVDAIRAVLTEAIEVGGSTLRDYAAADGALGYFQHRFRVYDRASTPCPTTNCAGTIARLVQSGRSTFYCPVCQK